MREKLPRYFLLSFVSFCFFTAVFFTIAHVQEAAAEQSSFIEPETASSMKIVPTPTIFMGTIQQSDVPVIKQAAIPTPTPTTIVTPTPTTVPTMIPTATPAPTAIPSPTPTETPIPTETAQPSSSDLETLFSQYSAQYSVSEDELKKIAQCESGFNTNSDTGLYAGMFQFSATTWESERNAMGLDPNPDLRKDAGEAIRTTAYMLSRGGENAWPNCH
jgi:hypothetical protein